MADTARKRRELVNGLHHEFVDRTQQELSRAERYCLFLSLVMIDISEFARAIANRPLSDSISIDAIYAQLESSLKNSLRSSDVVSPFDRNRLGILLVETSRAGLESVRRRIDVFVKDFLKGELGLPFEPPVEISAASYPEEADRFSSISSLLDRAS